MRIIFTGTRHLKDDAIIRDALNALGVTRLNLSEITFVHGAAPGVDSLVDVIGREWGARLEVYPAQWAKHGNAAGPIRNRLMVSKGADVCLAFPDPMSIGTADCIEAAWRAGIKTLVYPVVV